MQHLCLGLEGTQNVSQEQYLVVFTIKESASIFQQLLEKVFHMFQKIKHEEQKPDGHLCQLILNVTVY